MGATGTVTGSKYLLEADQNKFLIDCGLFQGLKELRLRNWAALPIDPKLIDAVILTHAHIDHTGYLPLLVKHGFKGKIFASPGTKDLCELLLPDSGFLQEEEAAFANKHGYSKHHPALPLYTQEDANKALKQFEVVDFHFYHSLTPSLKFKLHHAGHIIGASLVEFHHKNTSLLFSGDLGRPFDSVMREPEPIWNADYLVLESTYGDRMHEHVNPMDKLGIIINETAKLGGSVLIPAFAVGRAQSLLYYIHQLKKINKIPNLPVYLDSPMAQNATNLMCKYKEELRLSKQQCSDVCGVATYVTTIDESKKIDSLHVPSIIISASGMATGGRVLHHLKNLAPNPRNTIVFAGYQALETRGDRIVKGEKTVKIHGELVAIKARVELLHNISAHADYNEILGWLGNFKRAPKRVFLTHGEPHSRASLKSKIEAKYKWSCMMPEYMQTESLT